MYSPSHPLRCILPRLAALLFLGAAFSGCATIVASELAQPEPATPRHPHPSRLNVACYALLPLTVPFDLVTLPVQIVMFRHAFPSG